MGVVNFPADLQPGKNPTTESTEGMAGPRVQIPTPGFKPKAIQSVVYFPHQLHHPGSCDNNYFTNSTTRNS